MMADATAEHRRRLRALLDEAAQASEGLIDTAAAADAQVLKLSHLLVKDEAGKTVVFAARFDRPQTEWMFRVELPRRLLGEASALSAMGADADLGPAAALVFFTEVWMAPESDARPRDNPDRTEAVAFHALDRQGNHMMASRQILRGGTARLLPLVIAGEHGASNTAFVMGGARG